MNAAEGTFYSMGGFSSLIDATSTACARTAARS